MPYRTVPRRIRYEITFTYDRQSYSTPSPVSIGMGDRLRRCRWGDPPRYVTSHPGQLSLAIPLWIGEMSMAMSSASAGKKQQVRNSRHGDLIVVNRSNLLVLPFKRKLNSDLFYVACEEHNLERLHLRNNQSSPQLVYSHRYEAHLISLTTYDAMQICLRFNYL